MYKYKTAVKKRIGEHICPYCKKTFHLSESLAGHIGGAHRRFITQSEEPKCKFCEVKLIEDDNWPFWAVKQRNLICKRCKRIQNRKSYMKRLTKRKKNLREHLKRKRKALAR